jgi:signal transduction histidine kinase
VYLTSLRVFDRIVPLQQSLTSTRAIALPYDRNFLSFEFVALGYTASGKNRYRYMLEGLDETWIDAGNRRYTSYTNLDPGHYVLRICASNNDGAWNSRGVTMAIAIIPPYWRTWWFRLLALVGIAGILFLMYRYRVNKLVEIERIRTSIATDLHDDIGSTLTEIALFSDVGLREVKAKPRSSTLTEEERTRLVTLFSDTGSTARTLIDAMNDIVWAIDPKNDSFEFLLLRMKMHATKMLEAKGINYDINIPPELASLRLPLGMRRRLFLIFKEAINNILRHARPSRVVLTMRREGRSLMMTIADDGTGFDPRNTTRGNGLHNMEERARSIGGELAISSSRGLGTTITLHAPIP